MFNRPRVDNSLAPASPSLDKRRERTVVDPGVGRESPTHREWDALVARVVAHQLRIEAALTGPTRVNASATSSTRSAGSIAQTRSAAVYRRRTARARALKLAHRPFSSEARGAASARKDAGLRT